MDFTTQSIDFLALAAIDALQPNAPIYAVEIGANGAITLILPSTKLTWHPPQPVGQLATIPETDAIPGTTKPVRRKK